MAQLELSEIQLGIASLEARFAGRIEINARLTRQLVSFQANKERPIFRWFKYKEGFSAQLVDYLLDKLNLQEGCLLDPFAGIGTTLFAASQRGMASVGIELLPVGCTVIEAQQLARSQKTSELSESLVRWRSERPWLFAPHRKSYPHLRITQGAFPDSTQVALEKYLFALEAEPLPVQRLLHFAALCVLEEISYTRKRWTISSLGSSLRATTRKQAFGQRQVAQF
jgi:hypothetical protein